MRRTRTWAAMLALLCCLSALPGLAEPVWDFPLAANVVEGKGGYLVLTNRDTLLDSDYKPQNLTALSLRSVGGQFELRREAAEALTRMFAAAEADGHKLYVKSAYRSWQTQNSMYHNRVERYNKDDGVVAFPGSSDHQTGLGVDILNYAWTKREGMTPAFGETAEARWMEENCARFGFILRYMPEKQEITGIIYEPWHFRYVGDEVAQYIMQNRLSLEEFDQSVKAAIAAYEAAGGNYVELCRQLNAPPAPKLLGESDEEGDGEVSLFYPSNP
ncbi:MAG: M15 family metallopeptidase [Clostridiales bacterium]|nr:M15 family metallopeptidase [Clostridiales bacterium]